MDELIYYVNGDYVQASQAKLSLNDLAIVRGFGVFDYLRTYDHVPFMLREHLIRLQYSAQQIDLKLPWSLDEMDAIVRETNDRNKIANIGIRIIVTGGDSASFMIPEDKATLSVLVHPITPSPDYYFTEGAAITTSSIPRFMPTVKSLNYLGAILAVREAEKAGAIEAVYKTPDGYVTEATRSNLFIVQGGKLVTPKDDILFGITRQAVIDAVTGAYEVTERAITYDQLLSADEVFITSSTKEIVPISRVDGVTIGTGKAGELTLDIVELFQAYVQQRIRSV